MHFINRIQLFRLASSIIFGQINWDVYHWHIFSACKWTKHESINSDLCFASRAQIPWSCQWHLWEKRRQWWKPIYTLLQERYWGSFSGLLETMGKSLKFSIWNNAEVSYDIFHDILHEPSPILLPSLPLFDKFHLCWKR